MSHRATVDLEEGPVRGGQAHADARGLEGGPEPPFALLEGGPRPGRPAYRLLFGTLGVHPTRLPPASSFTTASMAGCFPGLERQHT